MWREFVLVLICFIHMHGAIFFNSLFTFWRCANKTLYCKMSTKSILPQAHLGLWFLLIDWISCGERRAFIQNWTSKVKQGGGRILDVAGQGCWGSWKFNNFQGRHMYTLLYQNFGDHNFRDQNFRDQLWS